MNYTSPFGKAIEIAWQRQKWREKERERERGRKRERVRARLLSFEYIAFLCVLLLIFIRYCIHFSTWNAQHAFGQNRATHCCVCCSVQCFCDPACALEPEITIFSTLYFLPIFRFFEFLSLLVQTVQNGASIDAMHCSAFANTATTTHMILNTISNFKWLTLKCIIELAHRMIIIS